MSDATGQAPSTLREIAKTHRLLAELYAQLADESEPKKTIELTPEKLAERTRRRMKAKR